MDWSLGLLDDDGDTAASRHKPPDRVVRKRPAAQTSAERPAKVPAVPALPPQLSFLPGPEPNEPVGYASDCSGLDGGAFALQRLTDFRHHFASEVNKAYRAILSATHPGINTIFTDMTSRDTGLLEPFIGRTTIYTSGFPCPVYSRHGKQRGHADPSGDGMMIFHVVLAIGKLRPDFFILENVPEFATNVRFRQQFDIALRMLRDCADCLYNICWHILNSRDFGVAAHRNRLYIIGIRRDRQRAAWTWPEGSPRISLTSILDHVKPTPAQKQDFLMGLTPWQLHNLAAGLEKVLEKYPAADVDKEPWIIDIGKPKNFNVNLRFDEMPTITKTRAKNLMWYLTNRGLTVTENELLRCQGFDPAAVKVPAGVARSKVCEMVGNAYTVNVMEALLRKGLVALGRRTRGI